MKLKAFKLTKSKKNNAIKDLFRIMKISLILLFVLSFQLIASNVNGQDAVVKLKTNKMSVRQLISEIENQTDYLVVYSNREVNTSREVNLKNKSGKVSEYLNQTFNGTDIGYDFENNYIVLAKKESNNTTMGILSAKAMQQTGKTVTGTVTDSKGETVVGATLVVQGDATKGTVTDANGKYILSNVPENAVLDVSYVGMKPQRIATAGRTTINIILEEDTELLEELVVVGYGTMRKKDISGSVVSVKTNDINNRPVVTADQALLGKAAGVQVIQNAIPGRFGTVRVRGISSTGYNDPLWVIDGIPGSPDNLTPNDIESIDILKDAASTAIYGSRGANGVIIVTTKSGKEGRMTVDFDSYLGTQKIWRKLPLMNAEEFATMANIAYFNAGMDSNPAWKNPRSLTTTDWQDAVTRTGLIQNYNLNISGGSEKLQAMLGLNYNDNKGPLIKSDFNKYSIRFNAAYKINNAIKVGANNSFTQSQSAGIPTNDHNSGLLNQAVQMWPDQPVYNPDGTYNILLQSSNPVYYPRMFTNPVAQVSLTENLTTVNHFSSSIYGEIEVLKNLFFKSTLGINIGNSNSKAFSPKYISVPANWLNRPVNNSNWAMYESKAYTFINTLNYSNTFGKHFINVLAGMEASKGNGSNVSIDAKNSPSNTLKVPNSFLIKDSYGNAYEWASLSYFGRANYTFDDKYILQFNMRADASNNFDPKYRWGYFPSTSVAWRISQEPFLVDNKSINDLKLRLSYGATGNAMIEGNFPYLSTYKIPTVGYVLGKNQTVVSAFEIANLANPLLKWETQKMADIGLDIMLFNKLTITADYYNKITDGLLVKVPVTSTIGAPGNKIAKNAGKVSNKGFELAINYSDQINEFRYTAGLNLSTVKNEVISLDGGDIISSTFLANDNYMQSRTAVGRSIGEFYGYVTDGIYQNEKEISDAEKKKGLVPGDRRYKDLSGPDGNPDGVINDYDRTFIGSPIPKLFYGLNFEASYKGFDFSTVVQGQYGNKILNMMKAQLYPIRNYHGSGVNNGLKEVLNSWHGEGTSNTIPRVTYNFQGNNWLGSDFYVENGSFLRCRSIQLGYKFSNLNYSKVKLNYIRLYVNAQNLFTITKYSGYDPEISNRETIRSGVDAGQYPVYRIYTAGISIQF